MSLEIKEVHIKTTVNCNDDQKNINQDSSNANDSVKYSENINIIISECVEQVLEILKNKSER